MADRDQTIRMLQQAVARLERGTVHRRVGVITDDDPLSVALGGSDVSYTDVRAIDGAVLAVNDLVSVLVQGNDLIVLGRITDLPAGTGGAPGEDGDDGEDGRTILNGTGAPDSGDGVNGDFYIDTTAWEIYGPKTAGAWGSGVGMLGEDGEDGEDGIDGTGFLPGMMCQYGAAAAPTGWLLCDGAAISRSTYAALFAIIGTTYGAGNGSTTFNVPDLRGRVPVGADGSAGRLSANDSLGNSGGTETHTLTTAQMPSHTHNMGGQPVTSLSGFGQNSPINGNAVNGTTATPTTQATGGGGSHPNMQPYQVVNHIIKT